MVVEDSILEISATVIFTLSKQDNNHGNMYFITLESSNNCSLLHSSHIVCFSFNNLYKGNISCNYYKVLNSCLNRNLCYIMTMVSVYCFKMLCCLKKMKALFDVTCFFPVFTNQAKK